VKFSISKEEVPFMISEDLNIITVPRERDPVTIAFTGDKSTGKTLSFLSYICNLYHRQNQYIFMANDRAHLSSHWHKPVENERFITMLKIAGIIDKRWEKDKIPGGLPIAQLYPSKKYFSYPIEYDIDYIKIALSWGYILDNYREFLELGNSEPYFEELIQDLRNVKSFQEITETVNLKIGEGDAEAKVKKKINARLRQVWDSGIVNIASTDATASITAIDKFNIKKKFPAEIALMFTGAIPTMITAELSKELMDRYLNNKLINIFNNQTSDGYFRDNRKVVYIAIDEMQVLEKRFKETRETLDMIALEGRNRRIGLLYCVQNIASIPDDVADNTRYGILLNQSGEKDIKKLAALFDLSKPVIREIKTLDKSKRECIACTKERFHAYDLQTGKRTLIKNEAVKGIYLPPTCHTTSPIDERA